MLQAKGKKLERIETDDTLMETATHGTVLFPFRFYEEKMSDFAFQTVFLPAIPVRRRKQRNPEKSPEREIHIFGRLSFLQGQSTMDERENWELQRHFQSAFCAGFWN